MKKIFYLLSICIAAFGCTNQDIDFPDFDYQSVYFPYQNPLRTLILGDEVVGDNTIDREKAFSIGVATGGVYENTNTQTAYVELASELADSISSGGTELEILPVNYYTGLPDKIEIPAGSFFGKMRIDLTDEFFNDTLTVGLKYVIPVRIVDATVDTILRGKAAGGVASPDPRVASDWEIAPRDYTLFAVQYINALHGVYLLRGQRINTSVTPNDTLIYSKAYLHDNDFTKLTTKSLTESYMTTLGGNMTGGEYAMMIAFDESDKSIDISQKDPSSVIVSGTGQYYTKDDAQAESLNSNKHRTIYLAYDFMDGAATYQVNDTLVFVDTDVLFEEFVLDE